MFFFVCAEYNIGFIGGGSSHNLYLERENNKYKFLNTKDDVAGPNANGGYLKAYANYQINLMNNFDIKIELFGGHDFAKLQEDNKETFKPGSFFGIMGKGELDFYETYCIYVGIGLYCAHSTIHHKHFQDRSETYFLPTFTLSIGGSYYLNDRVSLCCEISHIGFWWGNTLKTEKRPQKVHQSGLRIGLGVNIHFEKFPFLKH